MSYYTYSSVDMKKWKEECFFFGRKKESDFLSSIVKVESY